MTENDAPFRFSDESKRENGAEFPIEASDVHRRFSLLIDRHLDETLRAFGKSTIDFLNICSELNRAEAGDDNVSSCTDCFQLSVSV